MDFSRYAPLAAIPVTPPSIPLEIEAGMEAALAKGPLLRFERRSIGRFRGIPQMDTIVDTLCDGLAPHGLRVVVEESMQMDGAVGLAVARL